MHATASRNPAPPVAGRKVEGSAPSAERAVQRQPVLNPVWASLATCTAPARGTVQRTCVACAAGGEACPKCAEEEERPTVQTKLRVGPPGDRYEMEADRVADHVMRMPAAAPAVSHAPITPLVRRQAEGLEEEEEEDQTLQAKPICTLTTPWIQRDLEEEEEEEGKSTVIQAKGAADPSPAVSPDVQRYIEGLPGRGQPLPQSVRDQVEPRFGYGFEGVRVHTDAAAERSAGALRARAYTVGHDVVFGAAEYHPHSSQGMRLLAHELTHVVQQGGAARVATGAPVAPRAPQTAGADPPVIAESERAVMTVRREPLKVGDSYVVTTPHGGNLLLRVQPNPDTKLHGADQCGEEREECPNSVGNVASGTTAVIKEKRKHDWYVIETTTTTHGTRIGFVNGAYLKPSPPAIPEGAYDEAKQQCVAGGVCEAPPEEMDEAVPEEALEAPVFEPGEAALESQEEGGQVEQFGVVQTDDGANLWPEMGRTQPKLGLLPQNTLVFVDRKLEGGWLSVYVEKHQRGQALPVAAGTHGFVDAARVTTDMPDPDAWLFRITKEGQGALALAAEVYPTYTADCALGVAACRDHRYLVNVLVAVNEAKGRRFLYKENAGDDWDQAKTKKATKEAGGKYSGGQIWVPGMELVKALEGQVSSGSISLEALITLKDILIGIAAFIVGLVEGALSSIADIFIGVYDLIKMAGEILIKLFRGTLISDAKGLWDDIKKIKISDILEMVGEKWNAPSTWDRWKFRGYVIGYAIMEILLLVFSVGAITAIKWAGKAAKFGKFAEYLSKLPKVKKFMEAAKALKGAGINKIRATMKAAEALSEAHGWAAKALRLPLGILQRLSEADIGKLKKLPQWVRERFGRMADAVKLRLLGCHSPCKVDVDEVVAAMKLAGKGGTKLGTVDDVLRVLKAIDPNLKTAKISTKLRKSNSALMKAIKEAGLTDVDFGPLVKFLTDGDKANPALAYRTFVRYVTSVVPAKVGPDIKKLNAIAAAMVKAEVRRGSALKGAMFEQWIAIHVPALASKSFGRITFDLRKLIKKAFPPYTRHVDKWVPGPGEIWDMKHHLGRVPTGQADDYAALIGKLAPDGNTVKSVNYLFPTKEVAELNKHLATRYNFIVYYVDEVTNTLVRLP